MLSPSANKPIIPIIPSKIIRQVGSHLLKSNTAKNFNINQKEITEWIKCKQNPLYYIYNYVQFEISGSADRYNNGDNFHHKLKRYVRCIYRYNTAQLMASRQLGKSTISAAFLSWVVTFFPKIDVIILNLQKEAALKNLQTIKYMTSKTPDFLQLERIGKSDLKTKTEFKNGSKIRVFYPTTVHSKSTIARSLTAPVLYIDEAAHITEMKEIFNSAQPILSEARAQAKRNGYPFAILITTTPNGTVGPGEWFYQRWQNGIESDILFDQENKWVHDSDVIAKDQDKNGFVKIEYHWSENPRKDQAWYQEQVRELSDERAVNQELDLKFVGSTNCIFDDALLSKFKYQSKYIKYDLPHHTYLKVFDNNPNPKDYYLIGVDTAKSLTGAYNSITIFSYFKFNQIAEFNYRLASFTKYGEIIDSVFRWLMGKLGNDNIILCIENNTIGTAPIEHLIHHTKNIPYTNYIYKEKKSKEFGVSTTGVSKDMMIGCLTEILKENPLGIKSKDLMNQISSIERTRGGTIGSTSFSDLFMSASFCAYVRKLTALEIMPRIKMGVEVYNSQVEELYKSAINIHSDDLKDYNKRITSIHDEDEIDKLIDIHIQMKKREQSGEAGTVDDLFGALYDGSSLSDYRDLQDSAYSPF